MRYFSKTSKWILSIRLLRSNSEVLLKRSRDASLDLDSSLKMRTKDAEEMHKIVEKCRIDLFENESNFLILKGINK